VPIDTHAHYVPPQLIAAIKNKGKEIGVTLAPAEGGKEALQFSYGFKVRPFFHRLIEPVAERHKWLEEQRIDHQIVGTWPDIFAYGLPREHCIAWHRMLNDTLAEWTADNAKCFSWISSVPLTDAEAAAAELQRSADLGAIGLAEVDVAGQRLPALLDLGAGDELRRDGVVGGQVGAAGEHAAQVAGGCVVMIERRDAQDEVDGLEDRGQAEVGPGDVLALHPR